MLSDVHLSPDASHFAGIWSEGHKDRLIVGTSAGGELRGLAGVTRDRFAPAQTIRSVGWASNDCLLMVVEEPILMSRVEGRRTRLFAVDLDGERVDYLGRDWRDAYPVLDQGDVLSLLRDDPEYVLLSMRLPGASYPSVGKVDLHTGEFVTVEPARWGVVQWYVDHRYQVRAAIGWGKPRGGVKEGELSAVLLARSDVTRSLEELLRWRPFSEDGLGFAAFTARSATIYVLAPTYPGGRNAVYAYDLERQEIGDLVFEHPEVDVDGVVTSGIDGRPLYAHYRAERPEIDVLDPTFKRWQAAVDSALPDRTNRFTSRSLDETVFIVRSSSDIVPPEYYLFDTRQSSLNLMFKAYPELEGVDLSPMEPLRYVARDGLTIHGYLTRPAAARDEPLPTIVLPHGGPWARDVWGWDPVVQFLANRGFAVFQPNFRGSEGYGAEFLHRGNGEWGLAMQDDITDGVRWLIAEGIADPGRIGIFGMSYGGYAALQGLVSTPELYRAGASFAGVTDLRMFMSDAKMRLRHDDLMERLVGERRGDADRLNATSPVKNADKIRVPVLLGHGTRDTKVDVAHTEAMARALRKNDVPVEIYLYADELHTMVDDRSATDFFEKVAVFFQKYLIDPT